MNRKNNSIDDRINNQESENNRPNESRKKTREINPIKEIRLEQIIRYGTILAAGRVKISFGECVCPSLLLSKQNKISDKRGKHSIHRKMFLRVLDLNFDRPTGLIEYLEPYI